MSSQRKRDKRKAREKQKKKENNLFRATGKETQEGKAIYQKLRKRGGVGKGGLEYITRYRDTVKQVQLEQAKEE